MAIELGSKVRDKITGFEGIAIGETRWLDEPQLIVLAGPEKTKVQSTPNAARMTGGPAPEPARRKDVRR